MAGQDIQYTTRGNEKFDGYITGPDGSAPAPGILLITAIFGIDEEMRELSDAWAADGFVVSVPDIFWRVMPGPTDDFEKARGRMAEFDFDQGMLDIEDLMNNLRSRPQCNGKVGVLGFCFGGRYAHLGAARLGANAAAAFHGTTIGQHIDEATNVTCPVSFHFGAEDPVVPMDEVTAIEAAYRGHDNAEIVVHEGVGHNFSMPYKPGYDEAVAIASRASVLRCFQSM